MSEKIVTPNMGIPSYRLSDPSVHVLNNQQRTYRGLITDYVLDDRIAFYNKIYALDALESGTWAPYQQNDAARYLDIPSHEFVLLSALTRTRASASRSRHDTKSLIIGKLDEIEPWRFISVDENYGPPAVDLQVKFESARKISGEEDVNTVSTYKQAIPTAKELLVLSLPVGLSSGAAVEDLYRHLKEYARTLRVGAMAIHREIQTIQKATTGDFAASLHAAVSMAMQQIG